MKGLLIFCILLSLICSILVIKLILDTQKEIGEIKTELLNLTKS